MKKTIKKIVSKTIAETPESIIPILEKSDHKVVSFDVFDTLIKRNVPAPQDVFMILERRYRQIFGKAKDISDLRQEAENTASARMAFKEVNLQEIYDAMAEVDQQERQWLMEEEVRIEHTVCQRSYKMGKVYDWCIAHKIPVILVTDMYLPGNVISELLCEAGYKGWRHLYISAERRANKADGTLFDIVLREEHLRPEELLHIGDSLRGDYLTPHRIGTQAVLLENKCGRRFLNRHQFYEEEKNGHLSYRIVDSLIKNNIEQYRDFYQRLGYAVVGPILYGYCKWLYEQVKRSHIKKVFFLAREGYFLKRGFDLLGCEDIASEVIQVSRISVTRPLLHKAERMDELLKLLDFNRDYSIEKVLNCCKLDEKAIEIYLKENGLNKTDSILTLSADKKRKFFEYIKPMIDNISHEQEICLRGYLSRFDFSGTVAICDVGWLGTIQNALQKMFLDVSMVGYYVGKKEMENKQKVNSFGFLFDQKVNQDIFQTVISTADLFELFFLSTSGSADYYSRHDGKFICNESAYEQDEESAKAIIRLQDAACDFIRDFKHMDDALHIDVDAYTSSAGYQSFIERMDNASIKELKIFSFLNMNKRTLVAAHGLGWYVIRPRVFVKEYLNSGCRALFLRSVFKIPLPYVQFVECNRKLAEYRKKHKTEILV